MHTIEVTVDKSHIVTIGERLYGESVELIRELINNGYDADATEVRVTIKDDEIIVEDDGIGMDLTGLKQYFNIGSTLKKNQPKSEIYKRDRIGEFGIGKFASLLACSMFEIVTRKDNSQIKVVFDKEEWGKSKDKWHLPLEIQEVNERQKHGTKVTLKGVTKRFDIRDVDRRILTEALERVRRALMLNIDFCPDGLIPIADQASEVGEPGYITSTKTKSGEIIGGKLKDEFPKKPRKRQKNQKLKNSHLRL